MMKAERYPSKTWQRKCVARWRLLSARGLDLQAGGKSRGPPPAQPARTSPGSPATPATPAAPGHPGHPGRAASQLRSVAPGMLGAMLGSRKPCALASTAPLRTRFFAIPRS